jgi:hypothetical protein
VALEIPERAATESAVAYWLRLRATFGWSDASGILAATAAGMAASDRNEATNVQILAELRSLSKRLAPLLPDPPAEK